MIERMGLYQRRYCLKPVGPHRNMGWEVMEGAHAPCPDCDVGVVDDIDGEGWGNCPTCHGRAYILAIPVEEFVARRDRIIAKYPASAVECDVYDPETGAVYHLEGAKPGAENPPLEPADDVGEQGTGGFFMKGSDLTPQGLWEAIQAMLPRELRRTWEEAGGREVDEKAARNAQEGGD